MDFKNDDLLPKSDAAEVWTFSVGNLPRRGDGIKARRMAKTALTWAKEQPGFIGIHPEPPHGTCLIYRTENDAKRAKNNLEFKGVVCGKEIVMIYIHKRYMEGRT